MTQLYRVLYCSRNNLAGIANTHPDEIRRILAISRHNNQRDGVTGGLLFSDGCFAQVLEGPLTAVETTFERIQCDGRHSEVTVIQSGAIDERGFPDWSMAFTGTGPTSNPLLGDALGRAFSGQSSAGDDVLALLRKVVVHENEWLMSA